jgi:hypothetical protein
LSYLAPDIVRALLEGRQPIELTPTRLLRLSKNLPHDWKEQRRFLGFATVSGGHKLRTRGDCEMGGVFCFARDQMISYVQKKPRVRRIIGCHHSRVDDIVPKLIACLSSKGRLAGVRLQKPIPTIA